MGVPIVYRKTSENIQANYTYYDVATGTAYITYFGCYDQSSNGVLTTTQVYSDYIYTEVVPPTTSYTKTIDKDFDVTVNNPFTLRGTATFNIPYWTNYTAGNTSYIYLVVNLIKYDGTTETTICTGTSSVMSGNAGGTGLIKPPVALIKAEITNATTLKKGDTLRVTVEGWVKATAGGMLAGIGHDPQNRTYSSYSVTDTNMIVNIPVKIDL